MSAMNLIDARNTIKLLDEAVVLLKNARTHEDIILAQRKVNLLTAAMSLALYALNEAEQGMTPNFCPTHNLSLRVIDGRDRECPACFDAMSFKDQVELARLDPDFKLIARQ